MTTHRRVIASVILTCGLVVSASAIGPGASARSAESPRSLGSVAAVRVFANCTALNKVYRHGVGRKGARDHVSGTTRPVTNFTVNTAVYNANKSRDRDKDGIACEKR